jgi:hypothetical protein
MRAAVPVSLIWQALQTIQRVSHSTKSANSSKEKFALLAKTPGHHTSLISKNFPDPNNYATSVARIGQLSHVPFLYGILICVELWRINWES